MVYGRLDVYWPDGPSETYQLDKDTVAVGRSSGNDVALDAASVSRYHISLTRESGKVVLRDLESVNGTYVDGKRIAAHDPIVLRGGEEILVGDLLLVYQPFESEVTSSTQPMPPVESPNRLELVGLTYRFELDGPHMPVTPGAHVQVSLTLENTASEPQRFTVEIAGVPREWVRIDRTDLEVPPGEEGYVTINFKPLRRPESVPGDYPISIVVRLKADPENFLEAKAVLRVREFSGFGMALARQDLEWPSPFELHVHNQGSGPLPLTFIGSSPALAFDIRPPRLVLRGGERQVVRGYIRPKGRALVGAAQTVPFDVLVQSGDASKFLASVPGRITVRALLPAWMLGGFLAMGLLAVITVAALLLLIARPRPAMILAFNAQPETLIRNVSQEVQLVWQVQDAVEVQLQNTASLTGMLAGAQTFAGTDTTTIAGIPQGPVTLRLVARGSNGETAEQTLTLQVVEPSCTTSENVDARRGPGPNYDVVELLPPGAVVSPDRRDNEGQWVRLVRAAERPWIPAAQITCAGFAPLRLLAAGAQDIPPTPLPTLTPSPTVPPSPTPSPSPSPTSTFTAIPTVPPTITLTATMAIPPTITPLPTLPPSATPTPSTF